MDITELLDFSVKHNASDLHLSAGVSPMIRIDGEVRKLGIPALEHSEVHKLIFDIMNDKQRNEYQEHLEIDFSFELPNIGRFRANAFNQSRGCSAVFRTIPTEIPTLDSIGAPSKFAELANLENGLVLVTGPTGSGKSTTLAAMVDHINEHQNKHILTIEDPIEFIHNNKKCLVNQREVHRDTHSFKSALRSALREDPDIILVGELRDQETISLALTAAETGHLVFATMHTNSAAKSVDRIVDVFSGQDKDMVRSMLSESLRAVIAQTLLKRLGGGRVACHEIMVGTPAIRNLIREDKVAQMFSVIQTGAANGMQTMEQHARQLLSQGLIDIEEIGKKVVQNDNLFQ
ncbi:type IV pilus twitching motility protein PilT [Vibrio maritimus]